MIKATVELRPGEHAGVPHLQIRIPSELMCLDAVAEQTGRERQSFGSIDCVRKPCGAVMALHDDDNDMTCLFLEGK